MKDFIKHHRENLQAFINCIKVGIFIADGQGNVLMLNDESEKTGGMTKEELVGKNILELVEIGYLTESSIVNAIKSKQEEHIVQELGSGEKLFITGTPLIQKGKIDVVICTERDITETMNLRALLQEQEKIAEKYESELEYLRGKQVKACKDIIANSFEMKAVEDLAYRVAKLDTTVLLRGESGTGKELIASLLHRISNRSEGPFIKINCAAIPENLLESELFGYEKGAFTGADHNGKPGMFELAEKGTLFLDEIGEMSLAMQSKLLRVLQEKEVMRIGGKKVISVDARIIAATNVDLQEAIRKGQFREDLYYRLNILPIEIPPLRRRREDIAILARYFVQQFNLDYGLDKVLREDAIRVLEDYEWPGNVRELRNMIERVMVSFDGVEITKFQINSKLNRNGFLPQVHSQEATLAERIEAFEKEVITDLMVQYKKGSDVAKILGVNKSTISRKIKKYGIYV